MVMQEVTDPLELEDARARREQFDRNVAWLQAQASKVYSMNRGRYICIAGQELFVADTARQALALGAAAHPDDRGSFVRYIPRERLLRVCQQLTGNPVSLSLARGDLRLPEGRRLRHETGAGPRRST